MSPITRNAPTYTNNMFAEKQHTIIAQSSKPEYAADTDWADRYYIPSRFISLAHPKNSTIILPNRKEVKEFVTFCEQVLFNRKRIRALYTDDSHYLLDRDIEDALLDEIEQIATHEESAGNSTAIVPYSVNNSFFQWREKIQQTLHIFGDHPEFTKQYGSKAILHRAINRIHEPSILEHVPGISTPAGYVCDGRNELEQAYERMQLEGFPHCIIKPVHGATGEGMMIVRSYQELANYTFPIGTLVCLEQLLDLDTDSEGKEVNCSIQYNGSKRFGAPSLQVLSGTHWEGNIVSNDVPSSFMQDATHQAEAVLNFLEQCGLSGPGGFDFVSSHGQAYLVDPNIGRFTGAHLAKFFHKQFAPKASFISTEMPHNLHVEEAWEKIQRAEQEFNQERSVGSFPLCHLQGIWSMWVSFGETVEEATRMQRRVKELLSV